LHGIAGVVGFLCTTIFSYRNINSAAENGLTYGRGIPLAYHISALLVFIPCVFIATWLALHVSNFIVPIENKGDMKDIDCTVDPDEDIEGAGDLELVEA
jgi:ammonia channel protein AmtB